MKKTLLLFLFISSSLICTKEEISFLENMRQSTQKVTSEGLKMLSSDESIETIVEENYFQLFYNDETRQAAQEEYYNNPDSEIAEQISHKLAAFKKDNVQTILIYLAVKSQVQEAIPFVVDHYKQDPQSIEQLSIELEARIKIDGEVVDSTKEPFILDFSGFLPKAKAQKNK